MSNTTHLGKVCPFKFAKVVSLSSMRFLSELSGRFVGIAGFGSGVAQSGISACVGVDVGAKI
jgi:hypothetical protein